MSKQTLRTLFCFVAGLFFGLALVKFGNVIVLEHRVIPPVGFWELFYQPWPIRWAYLFFVAVALAGISAAHWKPQTPKWILLLPLIWLGWQFVSATSTINGQLTALTLGHFIAGTTCFYLGWLAFSGNDRKEWFWIGLLTGYAILITSGFHQRFGGLEAARQHFEIYIRPQLSGPPPPEYVQKMASDRIFATLFYPNTLAGAILLVTPVLLMVLSQARRFTAAARSFLVGALGLSALACLYWSGSKSGWLIALVLGGVALLHLRFSRGLKIAIICVLLAGGLAGFFVRYAAFFERGATSVVARFDYWRAAGQIAKEQPILGSGPGTFSVLYARIKTPDAEMARLAHNDYLEQLCDSGVPGFLAFAAFIFGSMALLYRSVVNDRVRFATWLGLLGLVLQSFVEFHLYIPALAWLMFFWIGWLWGDWQPGGNNKTAQRPAVRGE